MFALRAGAGPTGAPLTARLLVYGTLRRGERNHGTLAGAAYLGPARTRAEWALLDLGPFPALVPGGTTTVLGELYAVPPAGWAALDALEEAPAIFRRERIALADDGEAAAYVLPVELGAGAPTIPGGDWVARAPRPAPGERPLCFAEVWARAPWRAIPGCPGRFSHAGGLALDPSQLLGCPLPEPVRLPSCPDPVLAWPLPGGGLIAYRRVDGWALTLNDPSGFARKSHQLGLLPGPQSSGKA